MNVLDRVVTSEGSRVHVIGGESLMGRPFTLCGLRGGVAGMMLTLIKQQPPTCRYCKKRLPALVFATLKGDD